MSKNERVARVIFRWCQQLGIDGMLASGEAWEHVSKSTRDMYMQVASHAIRASYEPKKIKK